MMNDVQHAQLEMLLKRAIGKLQAVQDELRTALTYNTFSGALDEKNKKDD